MPVQPGYGNYNPNAAPRNDFAEQIAIEQQKHGTSTSPVNAPNTALNTNAFVPANLGSWTLPVVGMTNSPGRYKPGGPAQWSTGSYGYQKPASKGGHTHKGVDIYADRGTAVMATVNGTITSMGEGAISGKYIKVRGDDGYEYYYAHLDSLHTGIARGQRVGQGQYLGGVGNTGNAAGTSHHLHFEIRKNGKSVNPNGFLQNGQAQQTTPLSSIPGLNTPGELQAYIEEQIRAAQVLAQGASGFDPATWNQQAQELSEEDMIREQTAKGQNILGATLTAMSSSIGGGQRTPMQKGTTALSATTGVDSAQQSQVPRAEDLRPNVEGA
jgi:hypothetical protein